MARETNISWYDSTFNAWIGCAKVHAGCTNCYAEADFANRRKRVVWGQHGTRSKTSHANWQLPLKWNREADDVNNDLEAVAAANGWDVADPCRPRVFCSSLADVFEHMPVVEWIEFAAGYRVSIFGVVQSQWRAGGSRSGEWRDLHPRVGKGGYLYFDVKGSESLGTVKVHRVVMKSFVGDPTDEKPCVRHLDGNPANNELWNLLYGTHKENQEDMKRHGTTRIGTRNGRSRLSPAQVEEIRKACASGESQDSVAERYGVGQTAVSRIVRKVSWSEPEVLPTFDGMRSASVGHVRDHRGHPLFRCECCDSIYDEPGTCVTCHQQLGPLSIDDLRVSLFKLIDATPSLDWLLLTKRPENIRKMWTIPQNGRDAGADDVLIRNNVWIGTSVSDQETANKAIPELLKCRDLSPCLFLSCEPLLGPIDLDAPWHSAGGFPSPGSGYVPSIDWVITGGESGPDSRPCDVNWIRDIGKQCKDASVPWFNKQLGSKVVADANSCSVDDCKMIAGGFVSPKAGDPLEWTTDLRVREFPDTSR